MQGDILGIVMEIVIPSAHIVHKELGPMHVHLETSPIELAFANKFELAHSHFEIISQLLIITMERIDLLSMKSRPFMNVASYYARHTFREASR